ncbi:multi-sensor signal transduction multi-kinase [Cystobacter fuscus DSM 2262]|uniref:Multi-sensor signal transduction multi-kinase n=1 Tax=Cystobacter fuscus (strain ATCC 25194 / DSM 2262 / NBRC 100088 / M29) TaxID=1242864 RepID=S9QVR1_CYSF2|nr:hypothetical protein [Cystobacter fuscus]EPX60758.1 multi-sensor signal transduction multi-kinase [Cystobacter fuscus DSM 2262]
MNVLARIGLLVGLSWGIGGCLLSDDVCTPADTTYSCCVKQHLDDASQCNTLEAEVRVLTPTVHPSTPRTQGTAVAVGTVIAAATLSSDGEIFSGKLRAAVEKILRECAVQAHETVNRRRLGADPTWEQCQEIVERKAGGRALTLAMKLGNEKHAEAIECARSRLNHLLRGRFSLEQRYRHDKTTDQLELVSPEQYQKSMRTNQGKDMKGTLVPDVVIHAKDNPLKTQFTYDFKFPCLESTLPTWNAYPRDSPYYGKNQGQIYERAFGAALRVTPWEII